MKNTLKVVFNESLFHAPLLKQHTIIVYISCYLKIHEN